MEGLHEDRVKISDVQMIKAVHANDIKTLHELIAKGQNSCTLTLCLCWASRLGYLPLVSLLIDNRADPNTSILGGYSPLLWASIFSGDINVIRYLTDHEANVNCCSLKRKQTPLHAAVIKGNNQIVELLIDKGANLDDQDYLLKSPSLHAVQRNLKDCVKTLILNNCNVNLAGFVNGTELSPLLVALMQNNVEITKMLIHAGARFEQTTIYPTFTLARYYKKVEELNYQIRPVCLKQQCRVSIRERLKPYFLKKLKHMDIPTVFKQFIRLDELNTLF